MVPLSSFRKLLTISIFMVVGIYLSLVFSGCSAGENGLLTITPEQYFFSAKESLETIDERNYEIRDLDEIIRIFESAEKNAKKSDLIDKSRIYLTLAYTLKAKKQYQTALVQGEYMSNRAEPFYIVNTKDVKETLRIAKKWLRSCDAQFRTRALRSDLDFVKGLYYTQKMLTQHSRERKESLVIAIKSLRRCIGRSPDFKADFRLFGHDQTTREVRLKLIETLALGGQQSDAYGLLSETEFADIKPIAGSMNRQDFAWHHVKGLVLAMMGRYEDAIKTLEPFKIVVPQDYPQVDEALWILEGVFDQLEEITKNEQYKMEARIVASMLDKLDGPYSKDEYSTAAHLFPRILPGDESFYEATIKFYNGEFRKAVEILKKLRSGGILTSNNRISVRLMLIESQLYSGHIITDDNLEEILDISETANMSSFQAERAGYLLARYVMDEDNNFSTRRIDHSGQDFIKSISGKPWAIGIDYKRGEVKRARTNLRKRNLEEDEADETVKREPGELKIEAYVNREEDWIVSTNLYLLSLPELHLLTDGKVVGREDEGQDWIFKSKQIDEIKRRNRYLAVIEYDNSDSEKSVQGMIFTPR